MASNDTGTASQLEGNHQQDTGHELHSNSRIPKLSLEDTFRALCAVLWDTSNSDDWRDVILYQFVCEGDADFGRAANLASSLIGRLKQSDYSVKLTKLKPGEGWALYDSLKLNEKSLLWRANFEAQRGEDPSFDSLSSTAVSSHNADVTSVYDVELDYYSSSGDNDYTNGHNGHQGSVSPPGDGNGYGDDYEHPSYHNYRAGSTPYNPSRNDNMSFPSGSERLVSVDGARAARSGHQDYDDRGSGISFRHQVRDSPGSHYHHHHYRSASRDTHYDEGERSGDNYDEYYSDGDHDHGVNAGPSFATVSLITHLAPRIQESGGEVKIDRYGSATIRFLSPRKNEL
ncbi:hypothetical protein AA313_de0205098 [Arthrobotrys entomopaga]|nr:hypothetical protein AA313_de0205098 [Arthrobotrys entomopaga]